MIRFIQTHCRFAGWVIETLVNRRTMLVYLMEPMTSLAGSVVSES